MNATKVVTSAFALTLLAGSAQAAEWTIDQAHTNVGFKVRHLMVTNVQGAFNKVEGKLAIDEKDITKSTLNVTVDLASVNTANQKRDDHLRSGDFFDVEKYPTMTFVSKKVKKAGKGQLKVTGDLTLHGVTKEVTLDVEGPSDEVKGPWGSWHTGFSATGKINRTDFGLTWNKALESGGVVVGEEVFITIDAEFVRPVEDKA